jgi:hypothetical protein
MKRTKLATCTAIMVLAMAPTAFAGNIGGMRTERTGNIGGVRVKTEQTATTTATGNIGGLRTEDLAFDISIAIRGNIAGLFSRLFSRTF